MKLAKDEIGSILYQNKTIQDFKLFEETIVISQEKKKVLINKNIEIILFCTRYITYYVNLFTMYL